MTAYYNENEPFAAQWLRNLIAAGHIAPGDVDERSIADVKADDLRGYTQCHFFAGIGGWSHALRLAGWPDDRPVWTGSCPCQPFSSAGKGGGFDDERHLWPAWFGLVGECCPDVVFGEQVASAAGLQWLDLVSADMEAAGYAFEAFDICAAGVGAPHIRQRLWFVADSLHTGRPEGWTGARGGPLAGIGGARLMEHPAHARLEGLAGDGDERHEPGRDGTNAPRSIATASDACGAADANGGDASTEGLQRGGQHGLGSQDGRVSALADSESRDGGLSILERRPQSPDFEFVRSSETGGRPGPVNGFWGNADWLLCRDGKWRPVESGTFPLAHGIPGRVGRLRAYGNAIVAPLAATFVAAYLDTEIPGLSHDRNV